MPLNVQYLAEAVSGWLSFEARCNRANLFGERYLSHPIGQYLNATSTQPVSVEENHPVLYVPGSEGHPPQIDFVVHPRGSTVIMDAIETKFIRDTRRSFVQEIMEDLLRLELIRGIDPRGGRWFLIAGKYLHVRKKVFDVSGYANGAKHSIFKGVLEHDLGSDPLSVELEESVNPIRKHWKKAGKINDNVVPRRFRVTLEGKAPTDPDIEEDAWSCFVWKVTCGKSTCTL